MATVIFTLAAQSIAADLGFSAFATWLTTAAAATAGGFLDQRVFSAAPSTIYGPRLDDRQVQLASEGSPLAKCYGPECRTSGVVIWMSDIIEVETTTKTGSKGSPGANVTAYLYHIHMAVAICEGEIQRLEKIWAFGNLLYEYADNVSISSNQISAANEDVWYFGTGLGKPLVKTWGRLHLTSPNGGPDLSVIRAGKNLTISGFSNAGNNGTRKVIGSWTATDGSTHVLLDLPVLTAKDEAAGNTISLTQTLGAMFDSTKLKSVTVYTGTASQSADSLIESYESTGKVCGFRDTAYVVLEELALADYGNRPPQLVFQVRADTSKTVAATIGDILETAGLSASDYDVSAVSGNVRGYVIPGPQAVQLSLLPLMVAHNLIAAEVEGKIVFKHRDALDEVTIAAAALRAYEEGSEMSEALRLTDQSGLDLPGEVQLYFLDPDNEYQRGHVRHQAIGRTTDRVWIVDLPLVLDQGDAIDIAKRLIWTALANRVLGEFDVPMSYLHLAEGDVAVVPAYDEEFRILVQETRVGHNGVIHGSGVVEQAQTLDFS